MPSFAPSTAARSHPIRPMRCGSFLGKDKLLIDSLDHGDARGRPIVRMAKREGRSATRRPPHSIYRPRPPKRGTAGRLAPCAAGEETSPPATMLLGVAR